MKNVLTSLFNKSAVTLLAAAIFILPGVIGWGFSPAWAANGTQAIKASDFLDSLGAVTHLVQGKDSYSSVLTGIRYLGIRNIRDDGTTNMRLVREFCSI